MISVVKQDIYVLRIIDSLAPTKEDHLISDQKNIKNGSKPGNFIRCYAYVVDKI
jgi:hypothetical protein